jgi:uncharacterized protein (TIGR03083 family)
MADVTHLAASQAGIRRRVASIGVGQWGLPTPCTDWSVKDLVVHMIEGSRMALLLLQGASAEESRSVFGVAHGPDLVAVHHPAAGDVPGFTVYQFRTSDYLLHSWDVARATGGDESLDESLVLLTWESMLPMASFIADIGMFGSGPSGTVAEDAALQLRLLDLTGRRP